MEMQEYVLWIISLAVVIILTGVIFFFILYLMQRMRQVSRRMDGLEKVSNYMQKRMETESGHMVEMGEHGNENDIHGNEKDAHGNEKDTHGNEKNSTIEDKKREKNLDAEDHILPQKTKNQQRENEEKILYEVLDEVFLS